MRSFEDTSEKSDIILGRRKTLKTRLQFQPAADEEKKKLFFGMQFSSIHQVIFNYL